MDVGKLVSVAAGVPVSPDGTEVRDVVVFVGVIVLVFTIVEVI